MAATVDDVNAWTAKLAAQHSLIASDPTPEIAALHAAVQRLAAVCENLLQQSRLLNLPPEVLLRVMRYLDATALARLACTARAFHKGSPSPTLLDRACDEAAEWQHGPALAALRPHRLPAAKRLRSLEEAIAAGPGWARQSAYSVRGGQGFIWPTCEMANEDIGGFHLAVVISASASGAIKRVEEEAIENAVPGQPDWAHKGAINLAARLAAPDNVMLGGGVEPTSRCGAVEFLAEQLCRADVKAANDTYTLYIVESLCYYDFANEAQRQTPILREESFEQPLKATLIRAMWMRSRARLGEDVSQRDQSTIALALELLTYPLSSESVEDVLGWLHGAMQLEPEKWQASKGQMTRQASHGARVVVPRQSVASVRSRLVRELCERGQSLHALSSITLPVAEKFYRNLPSTSAAAAAAWESMGHHIVSDLSTIMRELRRSNSEADAYERALLCSIKLLVESQRNHKEQNKADNDAHLPYEHKLIHDRGRLAELLSVRGRAQEAEQLQRDLVDECAALLEKERYRIKSWCARLMCFGLRWVKQVGQPEQGQLLSHAPLAEALSPPHASWMKVEHVFDHASFDGLGLPFALDDLPKDSYIQVGEAYWEPQVPDPNRLLASLDDHIDRTRHAFEEHQSSIVGGQRSKDVSYHFTEAQGLHTMLVSAGKLEEASKLLAPLALAYFEAGENGRDCIPLLAEPDRWLAERELLERLYGEGGVAAFRADIESKFEQTIQARTALLGPQHTAALRMRGRQAYALYVHGKGDAARETLASVMQDYGTYGEDWQDLSFGRQHHDVETRAQDAYSVAQGLLALLHEQGRKAEHTELEGKIKAAEKQHRRKKHLPATAAAREALDDFLSALKNDDYFNGADDDGLVEAAGWRLINAVREEWQEDPHASDRIGPVSVYEMTLAAEVLSSKLGKVSEAIDIIEECIHKVETTSNDKPYFDRTLWMLRMRLAEMLMARAKCLPSGDASQLEQLEEARKMTEVLLQTVEAEERREHAYWTWAVVARSQLAQILAHEAEANHQVALAAEKAETDDGLAQTTLRITAHRAVEQLGQAERLLRSAGDKVAEEGEDQSLSFGFLANVYYKSEKVPTAESFFRSAEKLRRRARIWEGDEEDEEEESEDDEYDDYSGEEWEGEEEDQDEDEDHATNDVEDVQGQGEGNAAAEIDESAPIDAKRARR